MHKNIGVLLIQTTPRYFFIGHTINYKKYNTTQQHLTLIIESSKIIEL